MIELMLSIAMLGVAALVWGGMTILRRGGDRRKGWLMLIAAGVLLANVLILALPAR